MNDSLLPHFFSRCDRLEFHNLRKEIEKRFNCLISYVLLAGESGWWVIKGSAKEYLGKNMNEAKRYLERNKSNIGRILANKK